MGVLALCTVASAFAQNKAIDFKEGMPFSDGYVAGNTLYVAGQEGPDANGKLTGTDITHRRPMRLAQSKQSSRRRAFR